MLFFCNYPEFTLTSTLDIINLKYEMPIGYMQIRAAGMTMWT